MTAGAVRAAPVRHRDGAGPRRGRRGRTHVVDADGLLLWAPGDALAAPSVEVWDALHRHAPFPPRYARRRRRPGVRGSVAEALLQDAVVDVLASRANEWRGQDEMHAR